MTIDWQHRLWLWGHQAGSHTTAPDLFGIDGKSCVSPAEAARYLAIPNVIMVRFAGLPAPPYDTHALALNTVDWVLCPSSATPARMMPLTRPNSWPTWPPTLPKSWRR